MCDTCGCHLPASPEAEKPVSETGAPPASLTLLRDLLAENDHQAGHNRAHFNAHQVLAINLMSSPGAGKTSLLEATIRELGHEFRMAVIEGDLETEKDAERIRAQGVEAVQITTGSACHLDAQMIHRALHQLDLQDIDLLFIENVGNLVCPASFDLGQHLQVVLLSVPEGDDKPAKYPVIFRTADAVLMTKVDLLPHLQDFDPQQAERHVRALASAAPLLSVSVRQDEGLKPWLQWLRAQVAAQVAREGT